MKPRVIGCEECGATFQVKSREPIVRCPQCGAQCETGEE